MKTAKKAKSTKKKLNIDYSRTALDYFMLFLAGVINGTGVTLFLVPLTLFDSGFSGTAFFLSELCATVPFLKWVTLSVALIILNFPLYIFAWKKFGLPFVIRSLFTIAVYSLTAFIYQSLIVTEAGTSIITGGKENIILAAIFGGLISGIGSGLTIRYGGAIDGIEVLAVTFSKKIGITVGTFVMVYNAILYIVAGIIFQSWVIPLYSIITYAVGLKAVDFVVEGIDKGKAAMIISDKSTAVAKAVSENFGRGVTLFSAKGYYSKKDKNAVYVVINRFQIAKLKKIITMVDPLAFVSINDVTDTLGTAVKSGFGKSKPRTKKAVGSNSAEVKPTEVKTVLPLSENVENTAENKTTDSEK